MYKQKYNPKADLLIYQAFFVKLLTIWDEITEFYTQKSPCQQAAEAYAT